MVWKINKYKIPAWTHLAVTYFIKGEYPLKGINRTINEAFFDKNWNLLHNDFIESNYGKTLKHVFKYDNKGNIIEEDYCDTNNQAIENLRFMLSYDNQNRHTGTISYYSLDTLGSFNFLKQGGNGLVIEESSYAPLLNEHNVSRYKYDGNGNKTEEDIQKPGGNLGPKYEYKYDDKARLTELDEFYEMGDFKKNNGI